MFVFLFLVFHVRSREIDDIRLSTRHCLESRGIGMRLVYPNSPVKLHRSLIYKI